MSLIFLHILSQLGALPSLMAPHFPRYRCDALLQAPEPCKHSWQNLTQHIH